MDLVGAAGRNGIWFLLPYQVKFTGGRLQKLSIIWRRSLSHFQGLRTGPGPSWQQITHVTLSAPLDEFPLQLAMGAFVGVACFLWSSRCWLRSGQPVFALNPLWGGRVHWGLPHSSGLGFQRRMSWMSLIPAGCDGDCVTRRRIGFQAVVPQPKSDILRYFHMFAVRRSEFWVSRSLRNSFWEGPERGKAFKVCVWAGKGTEMFICNSL